MIKHEDLEKFRGQYPYGSELFGVYQTLLGWRGKRSRRWFLKGYATDRSELRQGLLRKVHSAVEARPNEDQVLTRIGRIDIGTPRGSAPRGSALMKALAERLPRDGDRNDPAFWRDALNDDVLRVALDRDVRSAAEQMLKRPEVSARDASDLSRTNPVQLRSQQTLQFLEGESIAAGQLKLLRDHGGIAELNQMFLDRPGLTGNLSDYAEKLGSLSPFSPLDPENLLSRTVVSPIGLIHLFRQYFFELDSFLGSPVGHVWVAPHTTVELVEINSRRTVTESLIDESAFSREQHYGESFTLENLQEAVSKANQQDLSFGASVSGSHSWIVGSAEASSSFSYHDTQSESRQTVHELMRRQTQRVSSLMEKSVHTSFKTVTSKEELSSKRYVVSNPGDDVINYELRRKMRRVAVQVQDVGTYLSWQTFVDDPGRELGVAEMVHIAQPPNLANIPHPQMIVPKEEKTTSEVVRIPFAPYGHTTCDPAGLDDTTESWSYGVESSVSVLDQIESIQWIFPQRVRAPGDDYRLAEVIAKPQGDATFEVNRRNETITAEADNYYSFKLYMVKAHFHEANEIPVLLEYRWESKEDLQKIEAENQKRLSTFVAEQKRAYEEAYVKAARERINAASKIAPRRYEDLRQEERIAVYRRLVRSLAPGARAETDAELAASKGFNYPTMSDATRHAWSEILNQLFDLEKMLYFVAPEWWKPQQRSSQAFGAEEAVLDGRGGVVRDAPREHCDAADQPDRRSRARYGKLGWWGRGGPGQLLHHGKLRARPPR
jgi:hypothetical protein